MEQIFLFTGDNMFALRAELSRWTTAFAQKHGQENLAKLDAKKLKIGSLLDEIAVAPFIAEKRLVLVDGLPSFDKEDVGRIASEIHPAVLLIFREPKPDKRLSSTKAFLKLCTLKEFPALSPAQVRGWIVSFAKENGSALEDSAVTLLLKVVGENQDLLSTELLKLCTYADGKTITQQDVQDLVLCVGESISWHFIELLGQGKAYEAVQFAQDLLRRGESPYALWNRLLWMVESLALITAAIQEKPQAPGALSKSLGLGYGTVNALLPVARSLSADQLRSLVCELSQADLALKTGGYRSTTDAPGELLALIDRAILRFA